MFDVVGCFKNGVLMVVFDIGVDKNYFDLMGWLLMGCIFDN